ncbi:DUF560 domain-containing protein [Sagittula sp. NFXS13]|uniref:surface lipoprotein assembly modifier n=1 Tax=Sagittula sp. NFXS13 TaxID=2819095 RepID=UPI0032DFDF82
MRRLIAILLLGLGAICTQPDGANAAPDTWTTALELMEAGQTRAALPLLEQLVSAHPDNKHYRFELALALYRLERPFRAKWQLEQVRGASLSPSEAQLVTQFLAAIEAQSAWSGALSFEMKSESNANGQTRDRTVAANGMQFVLRPDSRAKPGASLITNAEIGYTQALSEKWSGLVSLSAYVKHNEERSLRDTQLTGRAGFQYRPNQRTAFAFGLLHGNRWVADDAYSSSTGVWAEYSQLIGSRSRLNAGVEVSKIEAFTMQPDSHRTLLYGGYTLALNGNARLDLAGYLEDTGGGLPTLTGQRAGIAATALYAWKGGLMTSAEVSHHLDRRRGKEPFFDVAREDRKTAIALSVYHRDFRIGSFAPKVILGAEKNQSNIPLARHDNQYLSIGLTRNF